MDKKIFGNKKVPFKVPENYFESFQVRLPQNTYPFPGENNPTGGLLSIVKPWLTLAAGILLVALVYTQIPKWFVQEKLTTTVTHQNEDSLLNALVLTIDEEFIQEWLLEGEIPIIIPIDTAAWPTSITEEEMAMLTQFE